MLPFRILYELDNRADKNGTLSIFFHIRPDTGNKFRIPTGIKIRKTDWNAEKKEIKRTTENYSSWNQLLKQRKAELETLCLDAVNRKKHITKEYIQEKLSFTKQELKEENFISHYEDYLSVKKNDFSSGTLKKYSTTLTKLKDFVCEQNKELSFANIDEKFIAELTEWYFSKGDFTNSGIGGILKCLKPFLKWSYEKGLHESRAFEKIKIEDKPADIFPLTVEQLKAIEEIELDEAKDRVRDIFLFQCYTGLRFQDMQDLTPEHVRNDKVYTQSEKTNDKLIIPLVNQSKNIITKYKDLAKRTGKLLPQISNQKANEHLKEIGSLAGLDYEVIYYRNRGAKRIEHRLKRYEKLSTHDARRTFITLSLQKGMNAQMIMKITGHKNFTTFERYVSFSDEAISKQLNFIWNEI